MKYDKNEEKDDSEVNNASTKYTDGGERRGRKKSAKKIEETIGSPKKNTKKPLKYKNSECIATYGQVTIRKGNLKFYPSLGFVFYPPSTIRKKKDPPKFCFHTNN